MNIWRLIVVMALPVAASMLVQVLYNVVDGVYISRISDSAVTAISLAQPVQNLLIGFAVSIAVGVNALMSRSLGEKDQHEASRALGNGLFMGFVVSLGFLLFGFLGVGPFYRVQSDQMVYKVERKRKRTPSSSRAGPWCWKSSPTSIPPGTKRLRATPWPAF